MSQHADAAAVDSSRFHYLGLEFARKGAVMLFAGLLARVVRSFRAGYAHGLAARGHIPLLALCPRRLSEDEVASVASSLLHSLTPPLERADVQVAITKLVDDLPSLEDVERVNRRLADSENFR